MRIQTLCGSEAVWKRGSFELVHPGRTRILQQWLWFCAMCVLWYAAKVWLLNASVSCFYCLKKWNVCKENGSGKPRLVAVVCSLKCFGNDSICWQLISVKATKHLPYLSFHPKAGKCLAVSTFWNLNFPPKPPDNRGYRRVETSR